MNFVVPSCFTHWEAISLGNIFVCYFYVNKTYLNHYKYLIKILLRNMFYLMKFLSVQADWKTRYIGLNSHKPRLKLLFYFRFSELRMRKADSLNTFLVAISRTTEHTNYIDYYQKSITLHSISSLICGTQSYAPITGSITYACMLLREW